MKVAVALLAVFLLAVVAARDKNPQPRMRPPRTKVIPFRPRREATFEIDAKEENQPTADYTSVAPEKLEEILEFLTKNKRGVKEEEGEIAAVEYSSGGNQEVEEKIGVSEIPIRTRRATCDLLSVETKWGSVNHAACAAHCLAMRRGFKGGRCRDGVCHCRK